MSSTHRSFRLRAALVVTAVAASAGVVGAGSPVSAEAVVVDGPFLIAPIPTGSFYLMSQVAAYDPGNDRHLVASVAHGLGQTPWAILTTLVGANGRPIAGGQALTNLPQELHTSPWHPSFSRNEVDIVFNPSTKEYLVVWAQGTGPTSQVPNGARWAQLFAQRYSASGARVGNAVRLTAPAGTIATCGYSDPAVEYNPATGGYMLAFLYGHKQVITAGPDKAALCPGVQGHTPNVLRVQSIPAVPTVNSVTGTNVPGGLINSRTELEIARHPSTGQFMVTWGTPPWKVTDNSPQTREQMAHLISPTAQPVGSPIVVSSPGYGDGIAVVNPVTGNWVVAAVSQNDGVLLHSFHPNGTRVGPGVVTGIRGVDIYDFVVLADGTYLLSTTPNHHVHHLGPTGVRLGQSQPITGTSWLSVGKPGDPVLVVGRGAQGTPLRNQTVGSLVSFGAGEPVLGVGAVTRRSRTCVGVNGSPGDVALVNLTPVGANGGGDGQLVSSDVTNWPDSSNVNFAPGSVDPNVAAAPIGADGKVCYLNSQHSNVHVIADHLVTISASAVTLATPTGAPARKVDTRSGLGGGLVAPGGRVCFSVAGSRGDVALVNLTPVMASGGGDGQLVSSDVKSPPVASNVNFAFGSVDPNVAAAPIGADGKVCYVNSKHSTVHVIADHLATISGKVVELATPTGAPDRRIDTRPPG